MAYILNTYPYIIRTSYFGKIKDLVNSDNCLIQFLHDVILKHPNKGILLQHLSELYVLVANYDHEKTLQKGETSWNDIMLPEQYEILQKNRKMIVGYMMITKEKSRQKGKEDEDDMMCDEHYIELIDTIARDMMCDEHYIEFIDTIIRKNALGKFMITKYEYYTMDILIPREIILSSADYWAKYFQFTCKEDIDNYIKDMNIDTLAIRWNSLYQLFGDDNDNA